MNVLRGRRGHNVSRDFLADRAMFVRLETLRLARLKRKASQSGKLDDRAAYVLAALDEGEEAT